MPRITATGAIIVVTALVSLLITLSSDPLAFQYLGGFIPARVSLGLTLPGAWAVPTWLTPLSAALIHAGIFHLGMNMLMLGFTGQSTERVIGARGLVMLYLIGAYAAAAAQWAVDPLSEAPMIGASGATSAVVGAYSLLFGRQRAKPIGPIPAQAVHVIWLALAWTAVNLLMWFAFLRGGVAIAAAAHIGGFLAGLALARPLLLWRWRGA
ncbi:rhomboid family intramembrane serine protease [Sphingomonas sp. RS6]